MSDAEVKQSPAADPAPPAPPAPAAPARPRQRRWLRRLVLATLLVIVLAIGGAQFILWSDFPRTVVVAQLERQLGLKITARSLSTGWFGSTTLRDVTAALPLSDELLLTMPRMHVRHTSLVRMILGRPLRIDRIEVHRPTLMIQQYASGRWNVQEALEVVGRATRRTGPAPAGSRVTSASIPALRISDATVRLIDNRGNQSQVAPLEITGRRDGPIIYRFGAAVPEHLALEGQIVPGGFWQHEFDLSLAQPDDWLRPFIEVGQDTQLRANWRGQWRDGELVGRVYFNPVRSDTRAASGFVLASTSEGALIFQPQSLLMDTGTDVAPQLMINSGAVVIDGPSVRATQLRLSGAGGSAEINGSWNWSTRNGDLHAVWSDLILREGMSQTGSVRATVETVFPGQPRIAATLVSAGALAAGGQWDARLEISGDGDSFDSINWRGHFPRLFYDWRRDLDLSGLALAATQRGSTVTLDHLSLPERGRLSGRGQIDFASEAWWLWVSGRDVGLARAPQTPLALELNAGGSFAFLDLKGVYLSAGDIEIWVKGFYDSTLPEPIELRAWLTHLPVMGDEQSPLVRGRLRAEADLVGTLLPLSLNISGELRGSDLHFRNYVLGDPRAVLTGWITAEAAHIETDELRLLDADWELEGHWPVDPEKSFELTVSVDALALERVGEVFGDQYLSGTAAANLKLLIPEPRLEALILEDSSFEARDVQAEPFHAEHVRGNVTLNDGLLRVEALELREHTGSASATASAPLRTPEEWTIRLKARDWPLEIRRAGSILGALEADLRVNLAQRAAWGEARLEGSFTRQGSEVGTAVMQLSADGRTVRLTRFEGEVLRGSFNGAGSYIADDPNRTKLLLEWRGLDAATLATWVPALEGFSGVYSGRLDVEPTDDPRSPAPLAVNLTLRSPDGGFRSLPIVELNLPAYANLTPDFRQWHISTAPPPSPAETDAPPPTARLADGEARAFARLTRRSDGTLAALLDASFQRLDLDQIVHAVQPEADPMPGRLSGNLSLAGDPRAPRALFGEANVRLSESDLGNFDPVGFLYDLMRVGAPRRDGHLGTGQITARLDNQSIQVTSFYLFNRGVEVRGVGAIAEVFRIPASPISGTLVGTARPLSALRLPFMADVDQILSVLQANATTVAVSGTLEEPHVRPTTLDEVGDAVRVLLLGDVQRERARP